MPVHNEKKAPRSSCKNRNVICPCSYFGNAYTSFFAFAFFLLILSHPHTLTSLNPPQHLGINTPGGRTAKFCDFHPINIYNVRAVNTYLRLSRTEFFQKVNQDHAYEAYMDLRIAAVHVAVYITVSLMQVRSLSPHFA
jgi:hypothetical protein